MATDKNKNNWANRFKTADSSFIHELLNNVGLSGGPSIKDLPYIPLTGLAALGISSKIKELRDRYHQNHPDIRGDDKKINSFSKDISKIRNVIDRNADPASYDDIDHDSGKYFYDYEKEEPNDLYDYEKEENITNIAEHPRFNSTSQGKSQKGRPFDRDEE